MDKTKVTIHVVSNNGEDVGYDPIRDGRTKSSEGRINAVKVSDGYSVVFEDDVFVGLTLSNLVASILQVFGTNLPDTIFEFGIMYHYNDESFDPEIAKHILDLDVMMLQIKDTNKIPIFDYVRNDAVNDVLSDYRYWVETQDSMCEEDIDETDDYEDEEDDDIESNDILSFLAGENNIKPKKKKNKKKTSDYYGRSRVWKNCKQPKKNIERHGVLIASDKSDLKKDAKIVKSFLKDFMPGNSKWKKEFRQDVLDRWMSMYAISRKHLKQLEKQHRKRAVRKPSSTKKIIDFTNKLVNMPIDSWNDPRK